MYYFEKNNLKIFSPGEPMKMFGGPIKMFPRAPLLHSMGLCGRDSVPDPAGGAYSAIPNPLIGRNWAH